MLHDTCHQARVDLFGEKKLVMREIQLLPSIIALFVRIDLSCSSISRLPPNRADGEAVIEVALFGTTALPSSTTQ